MNDLKDILALFQFLLRCKFTETHNCFLKINKCLVKPDKNFLRWHTYQIAICFMRTSFKIENCI